MSKLPLLTAKELIKILIAIGIGCKRQKGSHMFFQHKDGRTTIVPNHPGEKIDRGLLNKIIKQDFQMSVKEFLKFK